MQALVRMAFRLFWQVTNAASIILALAGQRSGTALRAAIVSRCESLSGTQSRSSTAAIATARVSAVLPGKVGPTHHAPVGRA